MHNIYELSTENCLIQTHATQVIHESHTKKIISASSQKAYVRKKSGVHNLLVGIETTHFVHIIHVIHTFSPHELHDSMDHNFGLSVCLSTTLVQTEMSTTVGWVAMIFCTVMSHVSLKKSI